MAYYYLNADSGDDGTGNGSSGTPWATIAKVNTVAAAGDTVYLTGDFGAISFNADSARGAGDDWITYRAWPEQTPPKLKNVTFATTDTAYRIEFDGFEIDPGYRESAASSIALRGASYLTFTNCIIRAARHNCYNDDTPPATAPFSFENDAIIESAGGNVAPSHITIQDCDFRYGYNCVRIISGKDWIVKNNIIRDFSDNGIQIAGGGTDGLLLEANEINDGSPLRGAWSWPGTSIAADWQSHKGEQVIQDATGNTAIFFNYAANRMWVYLDDPDSTLSRSTNHAWRLASDPDNSFFTPSGNGDNNHSDGISIEGAVTNIDVFRNTIYNIGGQLLKVGRNGGNATNVRICSNLFYQADPDGYRVYFETGEIYFYNNTVDAYANNDYYYIYGIRPDFRESANEGDHQITMFNNIVSGAIYQEHATWQGESTSDYDIWCKSPPAAYRAGANSIHPLTVQQFTALFVDRGGANYKLAAAVAAGSPHNDMLPVKMQNAYFEKDILGNPWGSQPSRGCYQFGYIAIAQYTSKGEDFVVLDVEHYGGEGATTYQWQRWNEVNEEFQNINGATTKEYRVTDLDPGASYIFRAVLTDSATPTANVAMDTVSVTTIGTEESNSFTNYVVFNYGSNTLFLKYRT